MASGPSADYPYGALERQFPLFKDRGLDLGGCFRGTLNIDISPATFQLVRPEYTFRGVRWTDMHPPEDFSFVSCQVSYQGQTYDGWIYYPHPETKVRNFQNPSLLEVIAPRIERVAIGDRLEVHIPTERMKIQPG